MAGQHGQLDHELTELAQNLNRIALGSVASKKPPGAQLFLQPRRGESDCVADLDTHDEKVYEWPYVD